MCVVCNIIDKDYIESALAVKNTIGLRVNDDEETEGLDTSIHGEKGYN